MEKEIESSIKDSIIKEAYKLLENYKTKGYSTKKRVADLVEWLKKDENVEKVSIYKDTDITVEFKDKTIVGILLNRDKFYGAIGELKRYFRIPFSKKFLKPCWLQGDIPNSKQAGVVDTLYDDGFPQSTPDDIRVLLTNVGYNEEFVSNDNADLAFFSDLDQKNYGVLFLRSHGAILNVAGDQKLHIMARPFFTSFPPASGYDGVNVFTLGSNKFAYAFNNEFVIKYMKTNKFPDSIFHLLVCHGGDPLAENDMIDTFLDRGVGCYTGWTDIASVTYGDPAAVLFFEILCDTTDTPDDIEDAIDAVIAAGYSPDPSTGAELRAYGKENMQFRRSICLELSLSEKGIQTLKKFADEVIEIRVALPEKVVKFPGPDGRPDGGKILPETKAGRRIFISNKILKY
ncbi:MAG: hypothetical protein ACFFAH_13800 [Promethearchaeota archaeon]